MGLKAPPPDPAEQMKEWQKGIKKEIRQMDRDISVSLSTVITLPPVLMCVRVHH
jgi:hypothetical protein